ncbi:Nitroimidazol reductase NimA, pyridoxamine 5'-phosphate oxidase superfamily [Fervidobacterium changbaicum]|nr:pyridoxamine 5'-phosphate oxidase family protein [Fervidobacterium changbaicum]SDG90259.1 Nitroimidazol reductase NimA, pyridoxamine 5'-phosphate oxidase superfamily [Fervidobacterium changbaicum]
MNDGIEREKKYLINEEKAQKLRSISKQKLGVVQWYLLDCSFLALLRNLEDMPHQECRVRYTVDESGKESWIIAFKSELSEGFKRAEKEFELTDVVENQTDEFWDEFFKRLSESPVTAKVRYFISETPAEVVLDEFIELDVPYNVEVKYMVEVELKNESEAFEKYEQAYELGCGLNMDGFKLYTNRNIAIVSQLPPRVLINCVKQILGIAVFAKMRRKDRELSTKEAIELLKIGEYGFLATWDGKYPYAVPVNYVYKDGAIYFHCASVGKKLDNISFQKNASFSVVTKSKLLPDKLSTAYDSVIAFGQARIIEGGEKKMALLELIHKYAPQLYERFSQPNIEELERECANTTVVKLVVEHITGKRRKEED